MQPQHDAIIVGAGFGGIGAAIQLKRLGYDDIVILERESDLGGTWHVNHYPGLAVDIASVTYSYSFAPNPNWTRVFARGDELKQYATHVADKYDVHRLMRFGVNVESARWDSDDEHWTVTTQDGNSITAKFLLTATGFLSKPRRPDIEGIETFAGTVLHTAEWDDSFKADGKRIAVIGTGATAVQLVPKLARRAADLTVYQRTPIWVVPKMDGEIPYPVRRLFARVPKAQRVVRGANTAALEAMMVIGVLHYRQASLSNRGTELIARSHLRRQVRDPRLRQSLTPHYSFGCKRPTFSNDYFPAFNKRHVHLETTSIKRIEPDGIVTADGHKTEIDTLVLATGFNIWDTNFPAFEIVGRDERNLGKWWREQRFQAYGGVTMPLFPNLFSLNSPYSYNGLSYFSTIEGQMKHMSRVLREFKKRGASTFEVTQAANDEFLGRMTHHLENTVFNAGNCASANSYYFNPHGDAALLRPTSTRNGAHEHRTFPLTAYSFA